MATETDPDAAIDLRCLEEHFRALGPRFAELAAEPPTGDGHYGPRQLDRIAAIWSAWWRGRRGLLEIVDEGADDAGDEAFLRGFAAGLLLVRAARELRERCHGARLLRKAFNRPPVGAGIPFRAYDKVQRGLLGARHLRRLAGAVRVYQELASAGAAPAPLEEVCERNLKVLHVSKRRLLAHYMRARTRSAWNRLAQEGVRGGWFQLERWLGLRIADITTRRGYRAALPEAVRERLLAEMRTGDVLVTRKEHALTNHVLPGYWPHAILYAGRTPGNKHRVIEALKDGVRERDVASVWANDGVVLLRPTCPPPARARAVARARRHVGTPYDFDFDFRFPRRMVCTEVVYRAYDGTDGMSFTLTRRFGSPTLSAEDLLRMALAGDGFALIGVRMADGFWIAGRAAEATVADSLGPA